MYPINNLNFTPNRNPLHTLLHNRTCSDSVEKDVITFKKYYSAYHIP